MQHQIWIGLLDRRRRGLPIRQIHLQQVVPLRRPSPQPLDAREVAGVPHLVEIEHSGLALAQQTPHHRSTDEAGAAGHQNVLESLRKRCADHGAFRFQEANRRRFHRGRVRRLRVLLQSGQWNPQRGCRRAPPMVHDGKVRRRGRSDRTTQNADP